VRDELIVTQSFVFHFHSQVPLHVICTNLYCPILLGYSNVLVIISSLSLRLDIISLFLEYNLIGFASVMSDNVLIA